jgi:membrane protease YdiL (CAAX protease family)
MRRRLVAWICFVALIATVGYVSRLAGGKQDPNVLYKWSTALGELVLFAIILGVILAITAGRYELLALRRPISWKRALLFCLVLLVVVYGVTSAIDPLLHGAREQGLTPKTWQPEHAGAYIANFVVIAGLAPFTEELLFRGLGFSLVRPYGRWTAIITIGIAFGLYHGLIQALPELAIFGCALAWLRSKTDSVYPGMMLHATFNGIALIAAVTL